MLFHYDLMDMRIPLAHEIAEIPEIVWCEVKTQAAGNDQLDISQKAQ